MKMAFFIISAILLLGVLFYAVSGSRMSVNRGEVQAACLREVKTAQESSLDNICTQEARLLSCAADSSFTYEAPNGCEISFLIEKGWR